MFWSILRSAIHFSTVFLYGSTGETIIEKSGHLNLGIPGIMCIGAVGGCTGVSIYANSLSDSSQMVGSTMVFMGILFAMLFAGLAGLLYGFMTITLRCNQNVTGLAITTFGSGLMIFWGNKTGASLGLYAFADDFATFFPVAWSDSTIGRLLFSYGPLVYLAILIAIVAAIIFRHTRIGLSLKAVGENPATADAVGINVTGYKYTSCILGAAIAGIGGLFFVMDKCRGALEYVVDAMGWLAVALVIFSMWRPLLGIFGSILFGILSIFPNYIDVSFAQKELVNMIPYLVTIIVLIVISIAGKKETQPPASLGLNYFREDR